MQKDAPSCAERSHLLPFQLYVHLRNKGGIFSEFISRGYLQGLASFGAGQSGLMTIQTYHKKGTEAVIPLTPPSPKISSKLE